jgi:hypothetical protein
MRQRRLSARVQMRAPQAQMAQRRRLRRHSQSPLPALPRMPPLEVQAWAQA